MSDFSFCLSVEVGESRDRLEIGVARDRWKYFKVKGKPINRVNRVNRVNRINRINRTPEF